MLKEPLNQLKVMLLQSINLTKYEHLIDFINLFIAKHYFYLI
jgi:hypothetical protein